MDFMVLLYKYTMVKIVNEFPDNRIRIGENSVDNDLLVASSKDTDIWFHLSSLPSCHIVLECNKNNPATKEMINLCATLCKQHTKYKNFKKLKVMYTEIRNVRRTAEPGQVVIKGKAKELIV
jgi:predicted ribosome quality control (RQC) complex YloA/Tae2 family protein